MRLEIENVLGLKRAQVELEPGAIVEVIGENATGKTSLAVAAQAVLAREMNPLGIPATQNKRVYLHDDAEKGEATLIDDGAIVRWFVDQGKIAAPNEGRASYPEAVGLVDYTSRASSKERATRLQAALLPDPATVLDQLHKALRDYLDEDDVVGVIKVIEERDWDSAASIYSDRARVMKRQWSDLTGATWGIRKGSDWRPDGWLADYDTLTVPQAEERVTTARDALSALHKVQAVSEAEIQAASAARERLPELESLLETIRRDINEIESERTAVNVSLAEKEVNRLSAELDGLTGSLKCPHCDKPLRLVKGVLVEVGGESERQQAEAALKDAQAKLGDVRAQDDALRQQLAAERQHESEVSGDLNQSKRLAGQATRNGVVQAEHTAALASAEADVEQARLVVQTVKAQMEAAKLHDSIVRYTAVEKAIGPEGVRARMLETALTRLNAGLLVISEKTGWPSIVMDEKGGVQWDGRAVQLCSESEKWRAQASIQLTLAAMTDSRAVVLDRADLLDPMGRRALSRVVNYICEKTQISVLLCSTAGSDVAGAVGDDWPIIRLADGTQLGEIT